MKDRVLGVCGAVGRYSGWYAGWSTFASIAWMASESIVFPLRNADAILLDAFVVAFLIGSGSSAGFVSFALRRIVKECAGCHWQRP
jgi:hypothetical protein